MSVYFLSTVHVREDVRVYHNEFKTILNHYPNSYFVVADGKSDDLDKCILDLGVITNSRSLRPILGAIRVFNYFRNKEKCIIHFHDPELLLVAPLLKLLGHTLFYDVHEDLPRQIYTKHWVPKPLMKIISLCVELTEKVSSLFIDHYFTATPQIAARFDSKKTTVLRNYPSKRTVSSEVINSEITHIAYLGHITKARGIYEMLNLILKLNQKGFSLRLKLGGVFTPSELLIDVQNHEGWQFVDFVGWVKRDDIHTFFEGVLCGLILLKPYTNYLESSPNKLFEYMAMGLPVIASDFPVWRGLIDDSDGVFFVPQDNINLMIDNVSLMLDSAFRERIKKKCKNSILAKYNWEQQAEKMLEVYERYE